PVSQSKLTLFRDGEFKSDPWRAWEEGDAPADVRSTHVPVAGFLEHRGAFLANPPPIGQLADPGEKVESVADDLARFSSVAIDFPAFTDGRGYSSARLVRERYGYEGELRAVGDVLTDQIPFMRRCGINAFVVTNAPTRAALEKDA